MHYLHFQTVRTHLPTSLISFGQGVNQTAGAAPPMGQKWPQVRLVIKGVEVRKFLKFSILFGLGHLQGEPPEMMGPQPHSLATPFWSQNNHTPSPAQNTRILPWRTAHPCFGYVLGMCSPQFSSVFWVRDARSAMTGWTSWDPKISLKLHGPFGVYGFPGIVLPRGEEP